MKTWIIKTGKSRRIGKGADWRAALRRAWTPNPPPILGNMVSLRQQFNGGMLPKYGKTLYLDPAAALAYCGWECTVTDDNKWRETRKFEAKREDVKNG